MSLNLKAEFTSNINKCRDKLSECRKQHCVRSEQVRQKHEEIKSALLKLKSELNAHEQIMRDQESQFRTEEALLEFEIEEKTERLIQLSRLSVSELKELSEKEFQYRLSIQNLPFYKQQERKIRIESERKIRYQKKEDDHRVQEYVRKKEENMRLEQEEYYESRERNAPCYHIDEQSGKKIIHDCVIKCYLCGNWFCNWRIYNGLCAECDVGGYRP